MATTNIIRELASSTLSQHAAGRAQQRSIPLVITDGLRDFGDHRDAGSGATSYFFTKRSWRKFAAYLGPHAKHYERYRNVYVIVAADGAILTICWRH